MSDCENPRFTERTSTNLGRSHRLPHVCTIMIYGKLGGYRLQETAYLVFLTISINFHKPMSVEYIFSIAGVFTVAHIYIYIIYIYIYHLYTHWFSLGCPEISDVCSSRRSDSRDFIRPSRRSVVPETWLRLGFCREKHLGKHRNFMVFFGILWNFMEFYGIVCI